jgi:hypothetical protein
MRESDRRPRRWRERMYVRRRSIRPGNDGPERMRITWRQTASASHRFASMVNRPQRRKRTNGILRADTAAVHVQAVDVLATVYELCLFKIEHSQKVR